MGSPRPGDDSTIPARPTPVRRDFAYRGEVTDPSVRFNGAGRRRLRRAPAPSRFGRLLRGLSGALAAGLLMLALSLAGVQVWALTVDQQGPGFFALCTHLVAAVVAVLVQLRADRRQGAGGAGAGLVVMLIVFGILWFWWWR